jgi:type VI secretion system protein VasJ
MTWRQIEEAPAARDEHQTNLPPPPPHLAERFDGLARQGSWVELVHQVETQVPEYPFWLDLHQWTALGLKTLGPTYANAHAAVCGEVRTLLQRCPELAESRFNDGTPMANEATAGWIGSTVLVSTGGASADSIGTRAAKATEEGQRAAWVTQAQSAMVGGDVQEGLRLFTEAIERTKGEHARFQLKVQLVKACVASRQESLAAAFLEELDAQIREHRLEQWQPDLVKDVLTLWWQVLKAGNDRSAQSRMQDIAVDVYRRLCRLDPISAVQLDAQGREGLLKRFRMA